ncbi:hypothetical protein KC338_g224 [Hortaea werneckii]|nr:hypothetical protein KC338_g224 [Hortaea werneckii]
MLSASFPRLLVLRREVRPVLAQRLDLARSPAPVLQHLRWRFNEVADSGRAVEAAIDCLGYEIVDTMSELVKQRDDLIVLEEGWFLWRRLKFAAWPYLPSRGCKSR